MARISYVDPASVTEPDLVRILDEAREYGTPRLESQSIRAHVPAVLRTFSATWRETFREGVLEHRVKELARMYVATSLECGYCAGQRSHIGRDQGLSEHSFEEIVEFRDSDRYSEREKAALRWAEAITWDPSLADDEVWEALHAHFSEPELVELGYFIALTLGQQRFLKTLDVRHGDLGLESTAGLAPDVLARLRSSEV